MLLRSCCRYNLFRQFIIYDHYFVRENSSNSKTSTLRYLLINDNNPKFSKNLNSVIKYFSNASNQNDGNDNLHNFSSISVQNKKMISKYLGLKSTFLNESDLMISNDYNDIIFNFCYINENCHDFYLLPIYFNNISHNFLNNEESRKGFFDQKQNESEFLFYSFDRNDALNFDYLESTDNKTLFIFDDIFDALAFYQQTKLPTTVIKLLNKNNVYFKMFCHKLNDYYKKIILWIKNDPKHQTLRKKCLENFHDEKILFINSKLSATQLLSEDPKIKFDSLIQVATPLKHPFILNFHDLKNDVYNEFSDPSISGVQWSRFPKLNEHLKGHRPGELTIITGPTGCGKTTFVSEYSLDLCMQGVPTLWGSFEIKNIRLIKLMMTQHAKKIFSFSNKEEFEQEAETFSKLPLYFMKFHGQTEIDLILKAAEHAVYTLNIKHIIIDNLQFMLGMNTDSNYDRFLKQDFLISCLRQFSTDYNCHITLVAHPRKEKEEITLSNNSLYGGVKASQEADNVLIIMNKFNARYRCNKYIQITKNRYYGSLGVVPLYFDKSSLCFSSSSTRTGQSDTNNSINQPIFDNLNDGIKSDHVSDVYRMRYLIENQ